MRRHKLGIPVFRQATVPGGSNWKCSKCERRLEAGEKVAKGGGEIFCTRCVREALK